MMESAPQNPASQAQKCNIHFFFYFWLLSVFAKAAVLDEHSGVMLTRLDTRASLFIYPPRCASVEQNVHVLHFIYPDFPKKTKPNVFRSATCFRAFGDRDNHSDTVD